MLHILRFQSVFSIKLHKGYYLLRFKHAFLKGGSVSRGAAFCIEAVALGFYCRSVKKRGYFRDSTVLYVYYNMIVIYNYRSASYNSLHAHSLSWYE